ncbi:MAG: methylenetetrahydrofolate reductase [NAD(P)H] [Pseudomonadales bacterium]
MTDNKRLSFEFFPPKTDPGRKKLQVVWQTLNELKPEFFSVTYGAGGSTREFTRGIVSAMRAADISVAPHLSFGGDDDQSMLQLLRDYQSLGVDRIVALRGDIPSGMGNAQTVHANELVAFIRKHCGTELQLEVAAYPEIHPQAESFSSDLHFLRNKMEAGANSAITQYFYNADAYFYFLDQCRKNGINAPIYAGIMPITNYKNLARFSANCGAEIPRWITQRLECLQDDADALREFGIEAVSRLCEQLLRGGAPGLHFYTMNTVEPTATICRNIGFNS